jgi:hypothetical protein
MYNIRKLFGYGKYLKKYPLYNVSKKTTLREKVNKKTFRLLKEYSNKITKNKVNKDFFNYFNKNYVSLFVSHHLRSKIYYKASKNEIFRFLQKKINYKKINYFDFIDLIYIIYIKFKFLKFLIIKFFIRSNHTQFTNCDILVEYSIGNSFNRQDLPISKKLLARNKNIKIKYIFSAPLSFNGRIGLKSIKQNYITKIKINELEHKPFNYSKISSKTKKGINFCIKNYYKNPLVYSIFLDFVMSYEYYFQLIKNLKIKIYINNNWDRNILPIRQVLSEFDAENIAFQQSYIGNKEDGFLDHTNDTVFAWGKYSEKNINKKDNYIKKILKIDPVHLQHKQKSNRKRKLVTIFDSTFYEDGFISPKYYNKFIKTIINQILLKKNVNLCIKYKNSHSKKFINSDNLLLIKKLKSRKKFQSFIGNEVNNSKLIASSDLIISINSISISAEALLNDKESINFCNTSIDEKFLNMLNKIHPFAYKNFDKFEKELSIKINFKNHNLKLKKLKNLFFENNKKKVDPVDYIDNYLKKNSISLS